MLPHLQLQYLHDNKYLVFMTVIFRNILISVSKLHCAKNCLFVCLFWDPQPHFSRGVNSQRRTYGDHPLPPRPLVTPWPCVSVCSLSPHTFVLNASCLRSVPSPVLLSYTYTLSSLWSVSLSYTYIQTPQKRTPQHISNPTNKRC